MLSHWTGKAYICDTWTCCNSAWNYKITFLVFNTGQQNSLTYQCPLRIFPGLFYYTHVGSRCNISDVQAVWSRRSPWQGDSKLGGTSRLACLHVSWRTWQRTHVFAGFWLFFFSFSQLCSFNCSLTALAQDKHDLENSWPVPKENFLSTQGPTKNPVYQLTHFLIISVEKWSLGTW